MSSCVRLGLPFSLLGLGCTKYTRWIQQRRKDSLSLGLLQHDLCLVILFFMSRDFFKEKSGREEARGNEV